MPFTVAIAGITSQLAQLIANSLLFTHPTVLIKGSSRDPSKLSSAFNSSPRVTLIQAEPSDADVLRTVVRDADVVICCYFADNATMIDGQKLLVDLCEEECVPRYIASDFTLDYRGLEYGQISIKDPMKLVQAHLESKKVVKGVHILYGMFMETFWTAFDVLDVETKTLRYWGEGSEKFDLTGIKAVADYAAAVAADETAVGFLKFRGDRKSMLEIATEIEAVYSFKPTLKRFDDEESVSLVQRMLEVTVNLLRDGNIELGNDLDNGRYPNIRPESLRDFLKVRTVSQLVTGESNVPAQIKHLNS